MGWNYLSIPKLQRCNRWSLEMDTLYNGCNYLSMLGLKLIHVSKRGHKRDIEITNEVEYGQLKFQNTFVARAPRHTPLGISSLKLEIELGRHVRTSVSRDERLCSYCQKTKFWMTLLFQWHAISMTSTGIAPSPWNWSWVLDNQMYWHAFANTVPIENREYLEGTMVALVSGI